jgi:hypothetical protein
MVDEGLQPLFHEGAGYFKVDVQDSASFRNPAQELRASRYTQGEQQQKPSFASFARTTQDHLCSWMDQAMYNFMWFGNGVFEKEFGCVLERGQLWQEVAEVYVGCGFDVGFWKWHIHEKGGRTGLRSQSGP